MSKRYRQMAMGASMVYGVLGVVKRSVVAAFTPEPRTCPTCTYRMVKEVRRKRVASKGDDGKLHTERHSYWLCGGCMAHYKRIEDGPFLTPDEDEWAKLIGDVRPEVPR